MVETPIDILGGPRGENDKDFCQGPMGIEIRTGNKFEDGKAKNSGDVLVLTRKIGAAISPNSKG